MTADAQEETLRFLASLDGGGEIVSTHISRVMLGRTRAFKLKRAVAFPYLDFSTPEKRLAMCEREVALNRRTAPTLYLGARRVTREADGELQTTALDIRDGKIAGVYVVRNPDKLRRLGATLH